MNNLIKNICDKARDLAVRIDQFMYEYDTYSYWDSLLDTREANVDMIYGSIMEGSTEYEYIVSTLSMIAEDSDSPEDVSGAQTLLSELCEF